MCDAIAIASPLPLSLSHVLLLPPAPLQTSLCISPASGGFLDSSQSSPSRRLFDPALVSSRAALLPFSSVVFFLGFSFRRTCYFRFVRVCYSVEMSLRPNARVEVRKKGYKLAVDADEARRKREDNMVEIRKSKREESLLKKRRDGMPQLQQFVPAAQTAAAEKKV